MDGVKSFFKKLWANDIVRLGTILFLITSVSALLLSFVNLQTKDIIEDGKKAKTEAAMRSVLPLAETFSDGPVLETGGATVFLAEMRGQTIGYCVQVSPNGYGGPLAMLVGIDTDGAVSGVEIVSMSETPGIGTQAQTPGFLSQFMGKTKGVSIGSGGDNSIDAITGATITSTAATKGVATALDAVAAYTGGGAK